MGQKHKMVMINTELERKYLEQNGFVKNEYGVFIYANRNGEHVVNMESILEDYYEWRTGQKNFNIAYESHPVPKHCWWEFWKKD